MRIACISASRIPSRAANSIEVMKVCQSFLDAGHEVRLWVPEMASALGEGEIQCWYGLHRAIPITRLPSFTALRRYDFGWKAVAQAARWSPDLVYAWPLQAAYFSTRRAIPTAIEIHDQPHGHFAPRLLHAILDSRSAVRILPITEALRAWLADRYHISLDPPRCLVAPMGVDLRPYRNLPVPEDARAQLALKQGFTIGYTGHLYPGRGLELMKAIAIGNPGFNFLWVGGEPAAVEEWRHHLAVSGAGNMTLTGFVPNEQVPMYQAACEILLMPYQRVIAGSSGGDTARFASPMKAFEYLAAGRAILSSDLPVLREVLDDTCAVLLPPDQPAAWDEAVKSLYRDPDRRQRLARAAAAQAVRYSWLARAERILAGIADV